MRIERVCRAILLAFVAVVLLPSASYAQSPSATVTGEVTDQQGRAVPGATIIFTNLNTNIQFKTQTNGEGIYRLVSLQPGVYRANVSKDGFKSIVKGDIELHVQDQLSINFSLQVGSVTESITVEGGAPLINTESAAVSTVVDRQFAENLPMNGRSFQTLIQLTPGVVITAPTAFDSGQFSVNGQRAASNYWMVDGVSANAGASPTTPPGDRSAGSAPSLSVLGGTNSLVSVDAMQEFRILTSTYAPEFGRLPGGQISIVTRSGTNQFHGTVFDFLRNDKLDANDWFANSNGLPRPQERQNDFGGALGGPILKNRTFFFFSYEGLRLRLPQVALSTVPCDSTCTVFGNARAMAVPALQPYLNAYPLPNGPEVLSGGNPTGAARFNASFSNPASLDAYSLRVDHKLTSRLTLFARYNYSPSSLTTRGFSSNALSSFVPASTTVHTGTAGVTWAISPTIADDFRFNYTHTDASSEQILDNFGGAVPLASAPFPSPFTSQDSSYVITPFSLQKSVLATGRRLANLQQQINIVDTLSVQRGTHSLKFGVDFRRLTPSYKQPAYFAQVAFRNVTSFENGNAFFVFLRAANNATLLFRNLGAFAQDTWKVNSRLTLTYGLRWDVDFAPSTVNGPGFLAITGLDFNNLSSLALAPTGTPLFRTPYGVAPRFGVAYQLFQNHSWQTVLRSGVGVFYDLATTELGTNISDSYPFGARKTARGSFTFPLDSATGAPPPITVAQLASPSATLGAVDPNLKLPYTIQWNTALEQALGKQQTVSASYIGSIGRRLLQTTNLVAPNASFGNANIISNSATSDYHALQIQFQRRLSRGVQALASYTWSHSIDSASSGSNAQSNNLVPGLAANANRGSSDFDIRSAFSAAITYDLPAPSGNAFTTAILRGWSVETVIQARSAPPVDLLSFNAFLLNGAVAAVRPNVVPGQPFYLFGAQCASVLQASGDLAAGQGCPGGKAFNPGAFTNPPAGQQGTLGRNALRGFGATQCDLAIHRAFPIHESLQLQFRAEMFNVLNHPNFGPPSPPFFDLPGSRVSSQMLGRAQGAITGSGLNALYALGGPRSIQLALRLTF